MPSHHSETPVTIHISAAEQDEHWLFSVSDNGPGIDEAYLQKIFEPFKRMVRHEEPGAGLGLAICRKIVESHGGKIWCESQPGAGRNISVHPAQRIAGRDGYAIRIPAAKIRGHPMPDKHNNHSLANVLLVDDSRADIEMTRFRLIERSRLQCNLFIASSGEEALTCCYDKTREDGPIDLVLLDINMPEMDGFEVLERIRAIEALQHVSVIMCTGSTYDKDMARAQTLGATGYLTKPIEFSKLKVINETAITSSFIRKITGYSLLRAVLMHSQETNFQVA